MDQPQKIRKTDTQSLARALFEDTLDNADQVKGIRDAAYKSGFSMAASIIKNYVRETERSGKNLSPEKLKKWVEDSRHWRNTSTLDDVPNIV